MFCLAPMVYSSLLPDFDVFATCFLKKTALLNVISYISTLFQTHKIPTGYTTNYSIPDRSIATVLARCFKPASRRMIKIINSSLFYEE